MTKNTQISKIVRLALLSAVLTATSGAVAWADEAPAAGSSDGKSSGVNGLYEGRQVIPNTMAIKCQISGEDVVTDATKIKDCLNKIIADMNSKDAVTKEEGQQDWQSIRQEQLELLKSEAVAKGAAINNYEKDKETQVNASSQTKTTHEDITSLATVATNISKVINSVRTLYAESMKFAAIDALASVDPSVLPPTEEEEKKEEAGAASEGKEGESNANLDLTKSEATGEREPIDDNELNSQGTYEGGGTCQVNGQSGPCADGAYQMSNGTKIYCSGGECSVMLDEVTSIGDASKAKRSGPESLESNEDQVEGVPYDFGSDNQSTSPTYNWGDTPQFMPAGLTTDNDEKIQVPYRAPDETYDAGEVQEIVVIGDASKSQKKETGDDSGAAYWHPAER